MSGETSSGDGWTEVTPPSTRFEEPKVGVATNGVLIFYAETVDQYLDRYEPLHGHGIAYRVNRDDGLLAVDFAPDDPTYTIKASSKPVSVTVASALSMLGIDVDSVEHFDFEWDDDEEVMVIDLSRLIEE